MTSTEEVAELIVKARRVVILTGAGVSTESGIPDFRGPRGLWKRYDPEDFTYSRFIQDPARYWEMHLKRKAEGFDFTGAKPNPAHHALAKLERLGRCQAIVTQNADDLHQAAGSTNVIEFHGSFRWTMCLGCGKRYPLAEVEARVERGERPPRCGECGGILKPDVVFFEEPIPFENLGRSEHEVSRCDLMLVIGTSAVVYPAAELPLMAKRHGAWVVEINAEPTPLTGVVADHTLLGMAGELLPRIVAEVERRLASPLA